MKQQIIHIPGGTAFSKYEDFLHHLRTRDMRDPLGTNPQRWWKDTFRADLGDDFEVYMPQMPNSQNAKYEEWKIWFERYFEFLRDGVVLIGHSQGGLFLPKYLSENAIPLKVSKLILIAPGISAEGLVGEDGGDFIPDQERIKDISNTIKDIHIFHSKDDDIAPFWHSERYTELLPDAEFHIFEDRGHFVEETFPELLDLLKKMA